MTLEEQLEVRNVIVQLPDYEAKCFGSLDEVGTAEREAQLNRQVTDIIDLGGLYVVRMVGGGQVSVIFKDGNIPLNALRRYAEQGQSPWE